MNELQAIIEQAWENRADLAPGTAPAKHRRGGQGGHRRGWMQASCASPKKSRRVDDPSVAQEGGAAVVPRSKTTCRWRRRRPNYFDKVPTKFADYARDDFTRGGFRVVPPAMVRRGAFIGKNVVLMPSLRQHRRLRR